MRFARACVHWELNSTCCKLLKQRDGGRWGIELLANMASLLSAREQSRKKLDEDDIMEYLRKSYEVGTKTYMEKGSTQRGMTNLNVVKENEAMQTMEALHATYAKFATRGAEPTREAFGA